MSNNHRISRMVEDYIAFKQGMGFQLKIESAELRRFAAFSRMKDHQGALTIDLALDWASEKPHYTRWYQARRLETVRCFAKYALALDPETQMPPTGIFGKAHVRTTPYIYSAREVSLLMERANELTSPDGLRALAIHTAIGLLWATGLRVCELCRLSCKDVDLCNKVIHIRTTKFHKERYVPIHPSVVDALNKYAEYRDRLYPIRSAPHFFLSTGGNILSERNLEYSFTVIRTYLLPEGKQHWDRRPPRLYDLRHSFACHTIIRWLEEGVDVNHHLYMLSTYLGHVKPSDTYWYLTGTPELLSLATDRFEHFTQENTEGKRNENK